jgi:hypothetical protein
MAEIRKFSDIVGVVATEDIVEGRFVLFTAAPSESPAVFDLGSDLVGVKLPTSTGEAALAKYVLGWAMDNREPPIYVPYPAYNWVVRNYGFETGQANPSGRNLPMTSQTVYLTTPSVQEGLTIPSGTRALAYAGGVYTFPSGHFVHSSELETPGTQVTVEHTAGSDRGKPKYGTSNVVGIVEQWNATDYAVTIRTLVP